MNSTPPIDWSAVQFLWDIAQTAIMFAIGVYAWWQNRERVTQSAIDAITDRMNGLERAIDRRPEFSHFDEFRDELAKTNGNLSRVGAELEATSKLLNRLHDYLLEHGTPR